MLNPGAVLQSRYQIIRLLAQGGMGAVYLAADARLGSRWVAIKENVSGDPRQFTWEAAMLAMLAHPGLPAVSDHFVEATGAQYLVMEYMQGADLTTLVQQHGALPEPQVLGWAYQILDALTYLHTRQPPIIHRDIQPANIRITPQGKAVLSDLGIAKPYIPGQRTTTGALGFTRGFSPPEQYGGGAGTDVRSDIYALGATLYFALTGRVPPESVMLATGRAWLIPPCQLTPNLSPQTEAVLLRAMRVLPVERFQSAQEMTQALHGGHAPALAQTSALSQSAQSTRARSSRQMPAAIIWAALGTVVACALMTFCIVLFLLFKDPILIALTPPTFTPTLTRTATWTLYADSNGHGDADAYADGDTPIDANRYADEHADPDCHADERADSNRAGVFDRAISAVL